MARLPHGIAPTSDDLNAAHQQLSQLSEQVPYGFALVEPVDLHDFDYMFLSLQNNPTNLLEELVDMPAKLKALGRAMEDRRCARR